MHRLLSINGTRSVDYFHRELGKIMWDNCGMARSAESLDKAIGEIPALREEFWSDVRVLGENETFNQSLEKAGRVADFLEFGELLVRDARHREESCGGHFRVEHQTEDGEALRDDDDFAYVAGVGVAGREPRRRCCTRSRSSSRTSRSRSAATSEAGTTRRVDLNLKVWRQAGPDAAGRFETYEMRDVSAEMSFLELFDVLNEQLTREGEEPVAFDHDCREGICGSCAMMINGRAHGPEQRHGDLPAAPAQAAATARPSPSSRGARPASRSSRTSRSTAARSTASSRPAATSPRPPAARRDANLILVPKEAADAAMDAAACIGCGACVAACPNSAAQLFTAAKLSHLNLLPQGQPERYTRVVGDGRGDGALVRLVHEPRRVRGGVPEGDLDRLHRA